MRLTNSATVSSTAKSLIHADFSFNDETLYNLYQVTTATISTTQPIRLCYTSETPTTTFGHPLGPSSTAVVEGYTNIMQLKFIRTTSSDAVVTITLE